LTITILLADDHPLFRKGLRILLEAEADFRVVGEAENGRDAIDLVQTLSPDIVVMDIAMPDLNGIDATREILSKETSIKVVALSMHAGKQFVEDMLKAGATGYILKKSAPEDIINGIKAVSVGEIFLSPAITGVVVSKYKELLVKSPLTDKMENKSPILSTKLNRPTLDRGHVHRPHLLEQFDKSLHLPMSLISGPAGYGKTLLATCWLETTKIPGGWVSLDEKDNDLSTFLNYFLAAIQSCQGLEFFDLDKETEAIINAVKILPVSALADKLINTLNRIEKPFILVLDDFHLIKNEAIFELLIQMLQHPPESIHLVLICRRDPPLPISLLRARGLILEIRTKDLRFNTDEIASLLTNTLEKPADSSIVTALEKKTEGWVTGLRLTLISMQDSGQLNPKLIEPGMGVQYIMEYLLTEIFSKQPKEIIQYLMGTAILDNFSESLCEVVCLPSDELSAHTLKGRDFIAWLKQENLFLVSLDTENQWFRFHHLFKGLLYRQLEQHYSQRDIDSLHAKACAWYAENDMIEEGVKHALARSDHEMAARLITIQGFKLLDKQQWTLLEHLIKMLPNDIVDMNIELLVLMSWLQIVYARDTELIIYLDKAESLSSHREDIEERIRGHLEALGSFQQYLNGNSEAALTLARSACMKISLNHYRIKAFAFTMQAMAYQALGSHAKALETMEAVMRDPDLSSIPQTDLQINFGFIYWIDADLINLKQIALQFLEDGDKKRVSPAFYHSRYFLGIVQYHRNELSAAEENLTAVIERPYEQYTWIFVHSIFTLALIHQARGRLDKANQMADTVVTCALNNKNSDVRHVAQVFKAELAFRQNRFDQVSRWIESYQARPLQTSHFFYVPEITAVKILLAMDTADSIRRATNLLDQLHDHFVSSHNFRFQIDSLALKSMLFDLQDNELAALKALTESLSIAEPGGFIHPFVDLGPRMLDLLKRLAGQNISVGYIGKILTAFKDNEYIAIHGESDLPETQATPLSTQPLVEPLTNREMEALDLLAKRLSNKEIAEELFISPDTVKKHLNNIYGKLNVNSRIQAVEKAIQLKIIY